MTDEVDLTYDVIKMFSAWQDPESKNDKLLEAASEGKSRLVRGLLLSGASLEHRNAGYDLVFFKIAAVYKGKHTLDFSYGLLFTKRKLSPGRFF